MSSLLADDLSGVRFRDAGGDAQEGRFARAVAADEPDAVALVDGQAGVIEDRLHAVVDLQIDGAQDCVVRIAGHGNKRLCCGRRTGRMLKGPQGAADRPACRAGCAHGAGVGCNETCGATGDSPWVRRAQAALGNAREPSAHFRLHPKLTVRQNSLCISTRFYGLLLAASGSDAANPPLPPRLSRSTIPSPKPMHTAPAAVSVADDTAPPMSSRLFFWAVTSALAGFLFGFDTVVISGAEKTIQALWGLSAGMHGVAMGAALYGTVLGSLLGGWPTDRFGRKATLFWIGVLYIVSAVGCGFAWDVWLVHRRAFPGRHRHRRLDRRRAALHLGNRPAGAPRAAGGHVPVQHRLRHRHRLRLQRRCSAASARTPGAGCSASRRFPSLIYTVMCLGLPESPRWLLDPQGRPRRRSARARPDRPAAPRRSNSPPRRTRSSPGSARDRRTPPGSGRCGCACRSCSRSSSRSSTSSRASTPSSTSRPAFSR